MIFCGVLILIKPHSPLLSHHHTNLKEITSFLFERDTRVLRRPPPSSTLYDILFILVLHPSFSSGLFPQSGRRTQT
ncbi:hypothetical protein VNO80_28214 [Phaseolus coccineus]|uniref:Uncharacterized protein n=1 Tax=Phaseolus coccineus TaxID=3886 RepID=A0AAN9QHW3_PHACN